MTKYQSIFGNLKKQQEERNKLKLRNIRTQKYTEDTTTRSKNEIVP